MRHVLFASLGAIACAVALLRTLGLLAPDIANGQVRNHTPERKIDSRPRVADMNGRSLLQFLLSSPARADELKHFQGRTAMFAGGGPVVGGGVNDLDAGGGVTLRVQVSPFHRMQPMAVIYEATVTGTVTKVDSVRKLIFIRVRPKDWMAGPTA